MNPNLPRGVTQLRCDSPLVLAKTWKADSTLASYSRAKNFSVASQEVGDIHTLSRLLTQLERDHQACIIRGELRPDAPQEAGGRYRRTGKAFEDVRRYWLALDIDDFEPQDCDPVAQPAEAVGEFLRAHVPEFATASHHWQLTGSAGHAKAAGKLKARAWFWLEEPRTSAQLKAWAKKKWPDKPPFDLALFSATQIHYTAAPIFEEGLSDPVVVRSGLKEGAKEAVSVPLVEEPIRQSDRAVAPASAGEGGTVYARRALTGIYTDIANAMEGERNATFYQKARRAFSFVHAGQAEKENVRQGLEGAALESGLDGEEVTATLKSAWSASQKAPDDVLPLAGDEFDAEPLPREALAQVYGALDKAGDDPGALFEPVILGCLATIRRDNPADWQRIRAKAKGAKVQVPELDRLTQPIRDQDQGNSILFPTIEPWPDPVSGDALVRELSDTLRRYVVCDSKVADAAALWIAFTWFIDEVHVAPIANITAPLPNCGKSTMLDLLERFSFQPLKCDGISSAALFRSMDKWQPTLLIDEVDTFLRDNEDARGVLNSGHRRNGSIIRVVGEDHEPTRFGTYGAKALCGIGAIASTLQSRSIRLELRRKLPHEKVENIRFMDTDLASRLQRQLCRLHDDKAADVVRARPKPVPGLNNRAQDNWEPLLQIADTIGGEWPERARSIAQAFTGMDDADQTADVGTELLKDIKTIFDGRGADRLFTIDLVNALCSDSEAPWNAWNRGKPITARQVGRKLVGFGIKSKQLRIGSENKKGYLLTDFHDAFKRYLSFLLPAASETAKQAIKNNGLMNFQSETLGLSVSGDSDSNLLNNKECFFVSDRIPSPREEEGESHPLL